MHQLRHIMLIAIILSNVALTSPAAAEEKTPAQVKTEMITAFRAKDYANALRAARRLYELTKQPTVLLNIARRHDLLKQYAEAIVFYRRFLKLQPQSSLAGSVNTRLEALYAEYRKSHREVGLVTSPAGATVTLEDGITLTTPFTKWLPLGVQRFSIRRTGYKTKRISVTLVPGKLLVLSYELTPLPVPRGLLSVRCSVKDAKVYAGSTLLGLTPLSRAVLPQGKHRLRIVAPGHRPWSVEVAIVPGKLTQLDAKLQRTVQVHRGTPRTANPYRIAAWSTLGTGLAIVGTGLAFSFLAKKKSDDANNTLKNPSSGKSTDELIADYNSKHDKANTFAKVGYAMVGVGGALLVTSVVLFFLKPKRERLSRFQFAPQFGPQQVGVTAQLRF